MSEVRPFHLATEALSPGIHLLEASAGTGKTFTLAGLYLRLIVEQQLDPRQILAVTFTVAATEELRARIRTRLREALDAFSDSDTFETTEDPVLGEYRNFGYEGRKDAARRIQAALNVFDEARITTIHGFCLRALEEHAFECGAPFQRELVAESAPLLREIQEDYWRRQLYVEPAIASLALWLNESPLKRQHDLKVRFARPESILLQEPMEVPLTVEEAASQLLQALEQVKESWKADRDRALDVLEKKVSKTSFSAEKVEEIKAHLDAVAEDVYDPGVWVHFAKLTCELVEKRLVKAHKGTELPNFFDAMSALQEALEEWRLAYVHGLFAFAELELPRRKAAAGIRCFDDLLGDLYDALHGPHGDRLAARLGKQLRAALIDEFQDTDARQYAIFRRIFDREEHIVLLIGDPKQAIYSFRGADIFAYLQASKNANARYTLQTNYRSTTAMVSAVNQLFARDEPFALADLEFHPVTANVKTDAKSQLDLPPGFGPEALQLYWIDPDSEPAKGVSPGDADDSDGASMEVDVLSGPDYHLACRNLIANEIAGLLEGGTELSGRPLHAGDFAVLSRSNAEGIAYQQTLRSRGIPSVLSATQSIFETTEATDLLLLLNAGLDLGDERRVRAVLATPLFGLDAASLDDLQRNEDAWQEQLEPFFRFRDLWLQEGFATGFRSLSQSLSLRARLLRHLGGERAITNYLHLVELLHTAESERRLEPICLVQWLREQIADADRADEQYQLRLESDAKAVQIVTLHKSKGLEYPIVFCPSFGWPRTARIAPKKDGETPDRGLTYHDRENGNRLTQDYRKLISLERYEWTNQEALSEELRLLYVGATRAQARCYLFGSEVRSEGKLSALARLLNRAPPVPPPTETDEEQSPAPQPLRIWAEELAAGSGGAIGFAAITPNGTRQLSSFLRNLADEEHAKTIVARSFSGRIDRAAYITSFSALRDSEAEAPDRDAATVAPAADPIERSYPEISDHGRSVFSFPKGARAGDFFHDLLERLDFAADPKAIDQAVKDTLPNYGFDADWQPTVTAAIERTLTAELPLQAGRLLELSPRQRLAEVEFAFPARLHNLRAAAAAFRNDGQPEAWAAQLERLRPRQVDGLAKGFIDLIFEREDRFYILDWKSNWLGSRLADYGPSAVAEAMEESGYFLQAHLYAAALDLHLQHRLGSDYDYQRHFGGVIYLFLRGLDPAVPDHGIWAAKPTANLTRSLQVAFRPASEETTP
jgi:exodeoxyribonuclease V beta subunit